MAPRRARRGRVAAARPARRVGHQGSTRHRAARGADSLRGPVLPRRLAPKTPGPRGPSGIGRDHPAAPAPRATRPAASGPPRATAPTSLALVWWQWPAGPAAYRARTATTPPPPHGPPSLRRPPTSQRPPLRRPPRLRAPPPRTPRLPGRGPPAETPAGHATAPPAGPAATRRDHPAPPPRAATRRPLPRRAGPAATGHARAAVASSRLPAVPPAIALAWGPRAWTPAGTGPQGTHRTGPAGAERDGAAEHGPRRAGPARRARRVGQPADDAGPDSPRRGGDPARARAPRASRVPAQPEPGFLVFGPPGGRTFRPVHGPGLPGRLRQAAPGPHLAPGGRVTDNRRREVSWVRRSGRAAAGPRAAAAVVQRQVPVG